MSKLFKLKEWLTVPESAKRLSITFGEEVTESDVLRLALDGRLRLSVYFVNHATARCGKVVSVEEIEWKLFPSLNITGPQHQTASEHSLEQENAWQAPTKLLALLKDIPANEWPNWMWIPSGLKIDGGRFLELSDNAVTLRGVWDLLMIGNERLDIEHEYQTLTGGPAVTLQGLDGAFVEGNDGEMCQLQESFDDNEYQPGSSAALERLKQNIASNGIEGAEAESLLNRHKEQRKEFLERQRTRPAKEKYYPAGGLPKDAVIVVRTEALREFEQSVNGAPHGQEKSIATRERNSLLTIIAAFCKYEGIDPKERGAAGEIVQMTEDLGAPVSDDTVRRILAKIPDALESRRK